MHGMFAEHNMAFERHEVIDGRTEASMARRLVAEASCVFLMGGHPGLQRELLREKGLENAIRHSSANVLGVSAGAINMAKRSLDTKESPVPYEGLGLADITVKPHFQPENLEMIDTLTQISYTLPIYAMEDDSAILVADDRIAYVGQVYRIDRGRIQSVS